MRRGITCSTRPRRADVQVTFGLANFASVWRDVTVPAAGTVRSGMSCCHSTSSADVTVTGKEYVRQSGGRRDPARTWSASRSPPVRARSRRVRSTAADHARGRSAGDGAGPDHQSAQRRGKGESVLPARLQPRSRHRLRDHRRRHAGEHADARAWARLLGSQVPDPRAGQRRAVLEGPYFADQGDFADRGRGQINYANALDAPVVRLSAGGQGWGRLLPRPRRASAAASCSTRSN